MPLNETYAVGTSSSRDMFRIRILPALYSGATCFVYPSYFEGFGLPVLEAMQCGAPVIAGNRTSIPELVADAGLLFDPFDTASLADALKRTLDDAEYRTTLRRKGLKDPPSSVGRRPREMTLKVYEKAVGLPGTSTQSESLTPA